MIVSFWSSLFPFQSIILIPCLIIFLTFEKIPSNMNNLKQSQRNYIFGGDGGRHLSVHMDRFRQHLIKLLDLVIDRNECLINDMAHKPQYYCRVPWTFVGERYHFLKFWTIWCKPNTMRALAGTEVSILVYTGPFQTHLIWLLDLVIERSGCLVNYMTRRPQWCCREQWIFIGSRLDC